MQKNIIFGPSLAIFAQNWANQNFLGKSNFLRKTVKTQMADKQTESGDSVRYSTETATRGVLYNQTDSGDSVGSST